MSEKDAREFSETVKVENPLENQGLPTENKTTSKTQNESRSEATANAPPPYNRRALSRTAETYELEKFVKKALLIFNQKEFQNSNNQSERKGTEKDELSLRKTFSQFGFKVEVENNLTHAQIMKKLTTYSSQDFTDYGCVAVAVLTHGAEEGLIRASDKAYNESDIINHFKDVNLRPTLATKPKIFIIQACRGKEDHTAFTVFPQRGPTRKDTDDVENEKPYTIPVEADMLVLHSSYKGKPSLRDELNGSWFIQVLCHEINSLARSRDLESILTRVKMVVATDLSDEKLNTTTSEVEVNKQMPVITSTLMRLLYLRNFGDPAGPFNDAGDETDFETSRNEEVNITDTMNSENSQGHIEAPSLEAQAVDPAEDDVELDAKLLIALGEAAEEQPEFGEDIHQSLAQRLLPILKRGLAKEAKEKLLKEYLIPENCKLLKAPILNPEISATTEDIIRYRDKNIVMKQDQLGQGIAAISKAITLLIQADDKLKATSYQDINLSAIKVLTDGCRILTDLHFTETQIRTKLIKSAYHYTPGVEKSFLSLMQNQERDDTLFGSNLADIIKASKAIGKQSNQIKNSTSGWTTIRSHYQDNSVGPPRYATSSRGARTTTAAATTAPFYRRPPPASPTRTHPATSRGATKQWPNTQ